MSQHYLKNPHAVIYINRIADSDNQGRARENKVDNYFKHSLGVAGFDVQQEDYVSAESQRRTNVSVANLIDGHQHKVLVMEAKRPLDDVKDEGEPAEKHWAEVKGQLKDYLVDIRAADGDVQDMFGLSAIGLHVRFFIFRQGATDLEATEGGVTLHVEKDSERIGALVKNLATHVFWRYNRRR